MEKIAHIAVVITQVIKTSPDKTPQEIIKTILDQLPECTSDEVQEYLLRLADNLGITYVDVNNIIVKLKWMVHNAPTDINRKTTLQNIAQVLYVVGMIASKLIPGKWGEITRIVLDAYEGEFKNGR
jgi:hypothetical protein